MPTLPPIVDRVLTLFLGACALLALLVFLTWLVAVIAAAAHWLRRLVRRGGQIRHHADHVHRDWEKWHQEHDAQKDGSRLSLSQAKRLKALGARTYRDGEEQ